MSSIERPFDQTASGGCVRGANPQAAATRSLATLPTSIRSLSS
ncbi:MAG TPA: hypothetical protein VHN80_05595 [Kineosporiaceae bacterium]|nr:hypothetical protein [Kineosporiaceae bacterium]